MIKAIIFDLGGVVTSSEVEKIKTYIAEYIGVEQNAFYEFFGNYLSDLTKGKISLGDVYSQAVKHFQLSNHSAQEILNEHFRIFQQIIKKLNEDVLSLVQKLKKNYRVVCLVNAELDVVPLVRKRGLYDFFQHAYISTEMGMQKPDPQIYLTVLKDLNLEAEETVFIDDKESNVDGAKRLGIHVILFKDSKKLREELTKLKLTL